MATMLVTMDVAIVTILLPYHFILFDRFVFQSTLFNHLMVSRIIIFNVKDLILTNFVSIIDYPPHYHRINIGQRRKGQNRRKKAR